MIPVSRDQTRPTITRAYGTGSASEELHNVASTIRERVDALPPLVAVAVADLLDVAARTADVLQGADGTFAPFTAGALAIARAYLGTTTDQEASS